PLFLFLFRYFNFHLENRPMPTLEWLCKDKVVNHHLDVPYRILERKYSFDASGTRAEDNGSENMIVRGDNLEALKALLPRYEGRVKCVYIDPPYNTGNENWVTTITSTTRASESGCVKSSVKKARICRATTNGSV
ncbi:MAG: hypothetical protein IKW13_05365, partial [Thermoguttaceae bacterium]|nr:hypothetical protein [Thermoguttaceae bacterium]